MSSTFKSTDPVSTEVPMLSSEPCGLMIHGSIGITGSGLVDVDLLWNAILPIDVDAVPENVKIHVSHMSEGDQLVSEIQEYLNSLSAFDQFKKNLCEIAGNYEPLGHIKHVKTIAAEYEPKQNFITSPKPSVHKKNDVFIEQTYGMSDFSYTFFVTWKFNFDTKKLTLSSVKSTEPKFSYGNKHRFLEAVKRHLPKPSDLSERTPFTYALESISNLEHVLTLGHVVQTDSTLNYSNAGKTCLVELKMKIHGRVFSMIWHSKNVSGAEWHSQLRGFTFEDDINDVSFVTADEFKNILYEGHLVYEFGLDRVIDSINENHSRDKGDVAPAIIKDIFNNDLPIKHAMAISSDTFDVHDLTRTYRMSHTISTSDMGFIRVYWEATADSVSGFDAWEKASYKIHSIKLSGVKFTYFHGTKQYNQLLEMLPKELNIEKSSLIQIKEYVKRKTEPLLEVWKLIG